MCNFLCNFNKKCDFMVTLLSFFGIFCEKKVKKSLKQSKMPTEKQGKPLKKKGRAAGRKFCAPKHSNSALQFRHETLTLQLAVFSYCCAR